MSLKKKITMWIIIKYKTKSLDVFKLEMRKKFQNVQFYFPKAKIIRSINNIRSKTNTKEIKILGDYMFCYHQSFSKNNFFRKISNTRGLKYFLNGFINSQKEIEEFIIKCKKNEDSYGYIKQSFFEFLLNKNFKFLNGPFFNMIFKIIDIQKNKLKIILKDKQAILNKEDYLFTSI